MCPVTFATLMGVMSGCAVYGPTRLLDPADPSLSTDWRPPPSSTSGLESFRPVPAKDWLQRNGAGAGALTDMPAMKGMGRMGDGK